LKAAGVNQKKLTPAAEKALAAEVKPLVQKLASTLAATSKKISALKAPSKAKRSADPTEQAVAKTIADVGP
jgi:hypothetical protein